MFSDLSFNDTKVDMVRTEVGMVWKENYRAKVWLGGFPGGSAVFWGQLGARYKKCKGQKMMNDNAWLGEQHGEGKLSCFV